MPRTPVNESERPEMSALSIDVIYAVHLKPGDLYAGRVEPSAPTRPVLPNARALRLDEVTDPYEGDGGEKWIGLKAGGVDLSPVLMTSQVLVIRAA